MFDFGDKIFHTTSGEVRRPKPYLNADEDVMDGIQISEGRRSSSRGMENLVG